MSTEPAVATAGLEVATPGEAGHEPVLDRSWELSPAVALRPERFGALAYNYGNRRLTFLKRPELVDVVRRLGDCPDARAALTESHVPPSQWQAYGAALAQLASADIIRPRAEGGADGSR